jgi:hypothetical protein
VLSEALQGFIRGLRGFISGTLRFRQRLRGHLREQLTQLLDGLRRPARARSAACMQACAREPPSRATAARQGVSASFTQSDSGFLKPKSTLVLSPHGCTCGPRPQCSQAQSAEASSRAVLYESHLRAPCRAGTRHQCQSREGVLIRTQ